MEYLVRQPAFTMAHDLPPSLQESLANSKCEYRQLGRSGLRVSVPIFGCMSFGDARAQEWAIEEEEVCNIYMYILIS